ncbi:MAG: SpaA isopeptide-forming pilin-related protein [Acutalibacteraceae bacterium]
MTRKARSHDVLGKLSALSMAVILMLSAFVPMFASTVEAGAAASETANGAETFTIHLSSAADSYWNDSNGIQVRYLGSSGNMLGASDPIKTLTTSDTVTVTPPSGTAKIAIDKLNAKGPLVTYINTLKAAAPEDKTLVLMDNTKDGATQWTQGVWYYAWGGTPGKNADWPGVKIPSENQITGTDVHYIYINPTDYPNIVFNNGDNGSQTDDLKTPTVGSNNIFYDPQSNGWVDYTAISIDRTVTLSVADRVEDSKNHIYITGEKTAAWSKYGDTIDLTTIYFKPSASWENAYVTYDEDDPYSTTVSMKQYTPSTEKPDAPLIFTARVPVGAKLTFVNNNDPAKVTYTAANVVYNGDVTDNTYIQADRQWYTLEKALATASTNVDYTVTVNNFSEATPSITGGKVVGVKATYFDYLSNNELTQGWRQGLNDEEFTNNYRKQFSTFNNLISGVASKDANWRYPLFFGDDFSALFFIDDYYDALSSSRTTPITKSYFRAANNANFLGSYNQSVLGLVQNSLSGGNLMVTPTTPAPWFNNDLLRPQMQESETPTEAPTQAPTYPQPSVNAPVLYRYEIQDGNNELSTSRAVWHGDMEWSTEYGYYYYHFTDLDTNKKLFNVVYNSVTYNAVGKDKYSNSIDFTASWSGFNNVFQTGEGLSEFYIIFDTANNTCYPVSALGGSGTGGTGGSGDTPTQVDQYAKIIDSYFPFVATTDSNGVTTYSFDSANAKDNVYFNWDSASGEPTKVNYGAGTSFGVMNKKSGYGIFPFNNKDDEKRNYGFGIKMEMEFTLPMNGVYGNEVGSSSSDNHAKFEYTGDDDLWVFVDNQLVLDLGGAHTPASGSIDFGAGVNTVTSTASSVYAVLNAKDISATSGSSGTYSTDIEKSGASVTNTFTINNTDPTRKHTMTVFYMERGTNDSNLKVSYTIQPVQNDLTVNKEVSVPDINSGIADAVSAAVANSDFGFTLKAKESAYANKGYTQTAADGTKLPKTTNSSGGFTLRQNYSANFTKDLTYNDLINVNESTPDVFEYDTYYTVRDNKTDEAIGVAASPGTEAAFNLVNKINTTGDPDSGASVTVSYTNTLKKADLTLDKTLLEENGAESTKTVPFEFTVEIDLDGDGTDYDYQTYDLEYTLNSGTTKYTATGGKLSIRPDQTATFINIPVGAKYRITETSKTGYQQTGVSGGPTGTIGENGAAVTFTNKIITGSQNLSAYKTLDGTAYANGDKFNFKAELIDVINIPEVTNKDATTLEALKTAHAYTSVKGTTDENGLVEFAAFNIGVSDEESARYVFSIAEAAPDTEVASQYTTDSNVYYACIDVSGGAVSLPNYYSTYENQTLSDAVNAAQPTTAPTFNNYTAGVDIQFTKVDENNTALRGAQFTLYSNPECTAMVEKDATGAVLANPATSDNNGIVAFAKIAPGTYYIKETQAPNGYQLLTEPITLTVENQTYTLTDNSLLSGNATTDGYTVKNLKQPELPLAGGVGVTMFYVLGALAVVIAGTAFVLYKKRINVIALAAHLIHRK